MPGDLSYSVGSLELSDPATLMARLEAVERDLAMRQNPFAASAKAWYDAKREVEKTKAKVLLTSDRTSITEKKAAGELAAYSIEGAASEAEYEATKAVIRVLEQRAMVLMALLKAQVRI